MLAYHNKTFDYVIFLRLIFITFKKRRRCFSEKLILDCSNIYPKP